VLELQSFANNVLSTNKSFLPAIDEERKPHLNQFLLGDFQL
jgi:hypothetical protein